MSKILEIPTIPDAELMELLDGYCVLIIAWYKMSRQPDSYWQEGDVEQKEAHAVMLDNEINHLLEENPWLARIPSDLYVSYKGKDQ